MTTTVGRQPAPLRRGQPDRLGNQVQGFFLRRRTADGSTLPRQVYADTALPGESPVKDTWIAKVLDVIGASRPGEAARLGDGFDNAGLNAIRVYRRTIGEERDRLSAWNDRATAANLLLDAKLEDLAARYQEAKAALEAELSECEAVALSLSGSAAEAVAHADGSFDPSSLVDATVLQCRKPTAEEAGDELGLPPADTGVPATPVWRWELLSLGIAVVLGLGYGIGSSMLDPTDIKAHWQEVLLLWVPFGFAIASAEVTAVLHGFAHASSLRYANRREARLAYALAASGLVVLSAIDATIVNLGLAQAAADQAVFSQSLRSAQASQGPSAVVQTIFGFGASLAFLLMAMFEGIARGRRAAVAQATTALSESRLAAAVAKRRSDPRVGRAIGALSKVRVGRLRTSELSGKLSALDANYEAAVRAIEAGRAELRDQPDEAGTLRIREALEIATAHYDELRHEVDYSLRLVEPEPWWAFWYRWPFYFRWRRGRR